MVSCGHCCRKAAWYLFDYETPKLVTIRSLKVGITNRVVQLLILAYIIGYVIVYKKGYQEFDTAESAVTTKLKGISSSLNRTELPEQYRRIWDASDYHIPPQENNAFFVLTNAIITNGQRQGICPEDSHVTNSFCNETVHCTTDLVNGNGTHLSPYPYEAMFRLTHYTVGVQTGECNKTTSTCMIHAWCPVQVDELE